MKLKSCEYLIRVTVFFLLPNLLIDNFSSAFFPLTFCHYFFQDIAAAAVLISMGALLGRITPLQLMAMGFFEIIFFALNEYLNIELYRITDVGGSITVHAFGTFSLSISLTKLGEASNLLTNLLPTRTHPISGNLFTKRGVQGAKSSK